MAKKKKDPAPAGPVVENSAPPPPPKPVATELPILPLPDEPAGLLNAERLVDGSAVKRERDRFASTRLKLMRQLLQTADVERRVARAVDAVLGADELPVNPFPTMAKLLRVDELAVAQQQSNLPAKAGGGRAAAAAVGSRSLWREGEAPASQLNSQLVNLARQGAVWRAIAPMCDAERIHNLATALSCSPLLASGTRTVALSGSRLLEMKSFSIRNCCSFTGAHAFGGRLVARPRTLELRDHVQVRGPAARLDAALAVFAEHIRANVRSLQATNEHFVVDLEVFTGDGDIFDDEASAEGSDGRVTANCRGTPERFALPELLSSTAAFPRALQAAVLAHLPIILNVLACVPAVGVVENDVALPPRWQFLAVEKTFCFYFEPTDAPLRTARSSVGRDDSMPSLQAFQLESLFQSVWKSDSDASWYFALPENLGDGASGNVIVADAYARYLGFLRQQICRLLLRCDHVNLVESLIYVLPDVPRPEREPLLAEMRSFLASDAAFLAHVAHQIEVLHNVLAAVQGAAVGEPKREFALNVAQRHFSALSSELGDFCARSKWADVEPVKPYLLDLTRRLQEAGLTATPECARSLRRLRRACRATSVVLADTLMQARPSIQAVVAKVFEATKVDVPVSVQPPSVRVKVVDVHAETDRQRRTRAYPAGVARETVLMQYAIDTQLDTALTAALDDVCTARLVAGNPMHAILLRIKSAAQYFELWRETDAELRASILNDLTVSDAKRQMFCFPAGAGLNAMGGGRLAIFGLKPALLLADHMQLHALRDLLGDFMPALPKTRVQRYEFHAHVGFCSDLLFQSFSADSNLIHAVELREDHFISGPVEQEAIVIHCQHIAQTLLRLHLKTKHIVAAIAMGHSLHRIEELPAVESALVGLLVRSVKDGHEIRLHAFALVQPPDGGARYVQVTNSFHLCHTAPQANREPTVKRWPPRTGQAFQSIFLSRAHAMSCLEADGSAEAPLLQRVESWSNHLRKRAREALASGLLLDGCQALLQLSFLEGDFERLVPGVGRLLRSGATRLRRMTLGGRVLQGILRCAQTEPNQGKCNQTVLASMFHAYRTPLLEFLASDTSCNFEPIRSTIQEAFYAVLIDLRQQSALNQEAGTVLEAVEDYMTCIEMAVASQVVANDAALRAAIIQSTAA